MKRGQARKKNAEAPIAVDEETVEKVALIARLKLSERELAEFKRDLREILAHFSEIREMAGAGEVFHARDVENELREDGKTACPEADAIIANFSRRDGRLMAAPKSL